MPDKGYKDITEVTCEATKWNPTRKDIKWTKDNMSNLMIQSKLKDRPIQWVTSDYSYMLHHACPEYALLVEINRSLPGDASLDSLGRAAKCLNKIGIRTAISDEGPVINDQLATGNRKLQNDQDISEMSIPNAGYGDMMKVTKREDIFKK